MSAKQTIVTLLIVAVAAFIFGFIIGVPQKRTEVKTETIKVERPVTSKESIDPKNLMLCYVYKQDDYTDIDNCQPYLGSVVVEGVKYFKVDQGDDQPSLLRDRGYSKTFYMVEAK